MDFNYDAIAKNILKYRLYAKLSQKQLAEQAGLGANYISHLETKIITNPGIGALHSIAQVLEIETDQLLYENLTYYKSNHDDPLIEEINKELNVLPVSKIQVIVDFLNVYQNTKDGINL